MPIPKPNGKKFECKIQITPITRMDCFEVPAKLLGIHKFETNAAGVVMIIDAVKRAKEEAKQ